MFFQSGIPFFVNWVDIEERLLKPVYWDFQILTTVLLFCLPGETRARLFFSFILPDNNPLAVFVGPCAIYQLEFFAYLL